VEATRGTVGQARQAGRSTTAQRLVLFGWAAKGVVYLALAWLVLQLAFGRAPQQASSRGALDWIAQTAPGVVAIVVLGVGLVAFALGRVLEVTVLATPQIDTKDKVEAGVLAMLYVVLALSAFSILGIAGGRGASGGSGGQTQQQGTALLLGLPGGQVIVAAIGVAVIAFGAYSAYKGVKEKFLGTLRTGAMSPGVRSATKKIGTAAYVTRGIVFALIGWFLVQAALTYNPQEARGLDGALREVAEAPWGPAVLTGIALGLLCYGAFCLLESRYRRIGSSATGMA
jgi:hypothetical protein